MVKPLRSSEEILSDSEQQIKKYRNLPPFPPLSKELEKKIELIRQGKHKKEKNENIEH